ncbi:hypothetical protein CEXT_457761 [Caerostris extrusa]|uniref:Uncharacterized protein n=1 Tax=Caerostris extrusa TaxID=172846 RepID=A0AAV4P0D8_CAEEX|nr:hypothetical protein CEXT_457761 [Caerostris extrusa]
MVIIFRSSGTLLQREWKQSPFFLPLFLRKAHLESHFLGYSQTSVRIPSAQGGNEELLSSFTGLGDTSRKVFIALLRTHEDRWIFIGKGTRLRGVEATASQQQKQGSKRDNGYQIEAPGPLHKETHFILLR